MLESEGVGLSTLFFLQNTCGCFWVFQSHFERRSNIVARSGRRVPNFLERKFCGKAVSVEFPQNFYTRKLGEIPLVYTVVVH